MADPANFWDAVFEIRRRDARFSEDAYAFVMDSLEFTIARLGQRRHVSARELLVGICGYAKERFGLMAWTVLDRWGVRTTADVGTIVFQLVESSVLSRREEDSREEFDDVFDLQVVLEDNYFEGADTSSADGGF
jgi:uncharacterized repeat protein (TIGR04138 family)